MGPVKPQPSTYTIGVDWGARNDRTAICVAEEIYGPDARRLVRRIERLPLPTSSWDVADRLGTIYRRLVARLASEQELAEARADLFTAPHMRPPVTAARVSERIIIYVDTSGGGLSVVEVVRDHPDLEGARITAVFIVAGEHCKVKCGDLEGSLGKAYMVGKLQSLLQPPAHIELPPGAEYEALKDELRNYEIRRRESDGKLTAGVFKTGKHDDMATSLGLACVIETVVYDQGNLRYA